MALGESIFAEALDLAEAALGEIAGIAACGHALDQLVAEILDGADAAERRRHGAPQLVRLGQGRASSSTLGDAQRQLLEHRHAHGLADHLLQLVRIAAVR